MQWGNSTITRNPPTDNKKDNPYFPVGDSVTVWNPEWIENYNEPEYFFYIEKATKQRPHNGIKQ